MARSLAWSHAWTSGVDIMRRKCRAVQICHFAESLGLSKRSGCRVRQWLTNMVWQLYVVVNIYINVGKSYK